MTINIAGKNIGTGFPPFVIAEMSGNHNQSLDKALRIVDAAYTSGADAIKLQTYTADSMTLNIKGGDFDIKDKNSLWFGKNLHDLYSEASTPWEWHEKIFKYAKSLGLICFSSPFDENAVDFLEDLGAPAYKIASFENIHLPLLKKVALTKKPLIISTGMATLTELSETVSVVREAGCKDLILLKCTSTYPASPKNTNTNTIPHMKNLFNCEVGLSDHTLGIGVSIAAVTLGATLIEKHFTLSRSEGGVDSAFSLEPPEFKNLVDETFKAWESLGKINYGPTNDEKNSIKFRRSIYASKNIQKGEEFSRDNIRIIRPGFGLPPKYYEVLIGKKSKKSYKAGTPLSLDNLF